MHAVPQVIQKQLSDKATQSLKEKSKGKYEDKDWITKRTKVCSNHSKFCFKYKTQSHLDQVKSKEGQVLRVAKPNSAHTPLPLRSRPHRHRAHRCQTRAGCGRGVADPPTPPKPGTDPFPLSLDHAS